MSPQGWDRPARHSASQCNTPQPPDPRKCHQRPRPREPVDTPSWRTAVTQSGIAMEQKLCRRRIRSWPSPRFQSLQMSLARALSPTATLCRNTTPLGDFLSGAGAGHRQIRLSEVQTTLWPPLRRPENRRLPPCRTRFSRRPSPPTNGSRQEALLATQSWEPEGELGARNQTSRGIKMRLLDRCQRCDL